MASTSSRLIPQDCAIHAGGCQPEIARSNLSILGHQHGPFNDMIEFTNVSREAML